MNRSLRLLTALSSPALICCCTTFVEDSTPAIGAIATSSPLARLAVTRNPDPRAGMEPHDGRRIEAERKTVHRTGPTEEEEERFVSTFLRRYAARGKPRIAILFNRGLSEDIREWQPPTDTATPQKVPVPREEPERTSPAEMWVWEFEEGFADVFLAEGAVLVDRPTILRIVAAEKGTQSPNAPLGAKAIEVEALRGYADWYMELLISREVDAPYGHEFHVKVIQVATGRILNSLTTLGKASGETTITLEYVATTDRGFEFRTDQQTVWPTLREVGANLALEIMRKLSQTI